jgi:hypothetical protein
LACKWGRENNPAGRLRYEGQQTHALQVDKVWTAEQAQKAQDMVEGKKQPPLAMKAKL